MRTTSGLHRPKSMIGNDPALHTSWLFQARNMKFILAAFLMLYIAAPWLYVAGFDNDDSWQVIMNEIAVGNITARFGSDIVFTYGPSSFLFSRAYHPELWLLKVLFWLVMGVYSAFLFIRYTAPTNFGVTSSSLLFLGITYSIPDYNLRLIFPEAFLMCLVILHTQLLFRNRKTSTDISFWLLLSFLFFAKGTLMVVAILVASAVLLSSVSQNLKVHRQVLFAASSLALVSAGLQLDYIEIPAYVLSTLAVGQGYFNGLYLPREINPAFLVFAGLLVTYCYIQQEISVVTVVSWTIASLIVFISWQHFLVRGNVTLILCLPVILTASLGIKAHASPRVRAITLTMVLGSLVFAEAYYYQQHQKLLVRDKMINITTRLTAFSIDDLSRDYQLKIDEVSMLAGEIAGRSFDVFDEEQAIPSYAKLNHRFRPTLLAFGTYNQKMIQANALAFEQEPPEVVLNLFVARTELYPLSYDTGWVLMLLQKYVVEKRSAYHQRPLFQNSPTQQWQTKITEASALKLGEWHSLPIGCDIITLGSFKLTPPSLWTKFKILTKTYLTGPPTIYLRSITESGVETAGRINPDILESQSGILISPLIDHWQDFIFFSNGEYDAVTKIQLNTNFPNDYPKETSFQTTCLSRK